MPVIWENWQDIAGWGVFIAIVLTFNLYFDWNFWWSLAAAFGVCLAAGLAALLVQKVLIEGRRS